MGARSALLTASVAALVAASVAGVPSSVVAQQSLRQQVVGTWDFVSIVNTRPDGSKRKHYGDTPQGAFVFEPGGRYLQIVVRPGRPKMKSDNRLEGTHEENRAMLEAAYASIGIWSVDESKSLLIRTIQVSLTAPNEEGLETRWPMTIKGRDMTVIVTTARVGGTNEMVLRRSF